MQRIHRTKFQDSQLDYEGNHQPYLSSLNVQNFGAIYLAIVLYSCVFLFSQRIQTQTLPRGRAVQRHMPSISYEHPINEHKHV